MGATSSTTRFDSLILFGDSITEQSFNEDEGSGVATKLAKFYADTTRRLDVLNRGYGGWNSSQGLEILPKIISQESSPSKRVRLMIIFWGSNDCVEPRPDVIQNSPYVPLKTYISNLQAMIHLARNAFIPTILVGPAPLNWPQLQEQGYPAKDRNTQRHRLYNDAVVALGLRMGIPTVGMWDWIMRDVGWKDGDEIIGDENCVKRDLDVYFSDGLHFKGKAYEVMYNGIMKAIEEAYPELLEPFPESD